jgi:hypothetical protein
LDSLLLDCTVKVSVYDSELEFHPT